MTTKPIGTEAEKKIRVRGTKVTPEQNAELVDLLSLPQNKSVLTMKPHPLKAGEMGKLWESIAKSLNLLLGPKKSAEDWRRYFVEWKSRTRKKARDFKVEAQVTGGGVNPAKPLSDIEEKLMGLLGWVSVQGCQDMPQEQEIQDEIEENLEENMVLPGTTIDLEGEIVHTYGQYNLQPERVENNQTMSEKLEGPRDKLQVSNGNVHSKRKKSSVNSRDKQNIEKKRRYTSSVSVLNDSAKIFADGADKISKAFIHFGDSIFALSKAITTITESKIDASQVVD